MQHELLLCLPAGMSDAVPLSVVIPTHNRAELLNRTLRALVDQNGASLFEIIVVDDGSTDETRRVVTGYETNNQVPVHYLYQPNRKQGAARNLGARTAEGDLLLFLGDDIVPAPGFLAAHLQAHRCRPDLQTAVIGHTAWPPSYRVTRFLRYIGEKGWQFGFSLIEDHQNVPFQFFYTSNVSLRRCFFLTAGGFDEGFLEYGWEDVELAWRLSRRGMRLVYEPSAGAYHHHPTTFRSFCRRQEQVGRSAWYFYLKHPELADFLGVGRIPRYSPWDRLGLESAAWICGLLENRERPDLSRYFPDLMTYYYVKGLRQAREKDTG